MSLQPVSSTDDRTTQLKQLERRFRSSFRIVSDIDRNTIARIAIIPSDPDFPFELDALQLQISIPPQYPKEHCQITVMNTDIPKGFSFNLENAFEVYARQSNKTLVQQLNWLDRHMEVLLQQEPAPTFRFVRQKPTPAKEPSIPPAPSTSTAPQPSLENPKKLSAQAAVFVPSKPLQPSPKPSRRRQKELDQLQSRFGPAFKVISSNTIDTVVALSIKLNDPDLPIEQMDDLHIKYHVPIEYPSKPCHIVLDVPLKESKAKMISDAFAEHCKFAKKSLFENLNWLNRNLAALEKKTVSQAAVAPSANEPPPPLSPQPSSSIPATPVLKAEKINSLPDKEELKDKRATVTLDSSSTQPLTNQERPVNFTKTDHKSEGADSSNDIEEKEAAGKESNAPMIASAPQTILRGTEIRLIRPSLENVSLFRCSSLHVMVKCAKCKSTIEVENILPEEQTGNDPATSKKPKKERWMTCPTCSSIAGLKFIGELVHQSASSIGVLQLAGCTLFDLLPSMFVGTCGQCMDDMPTPIRLMPDASPTTKNCFSCHAKMTVGLGEFRFVKIGAGGERLQPDETQVMKLKTKAKKQKDEARLTIGEPLPGQGTCSHLRRSKRWFRFACCGKLYACSICHDNEEDHEWEMARRHVCGLCSREQVVGKECVCGYEFEKGHKGAFWEGGQGVRDHTTMSRKDPHKHRGQAKKASKKHERVGGASKLKESKDAT